MMFSLRAKKHVWGTMAGLLMTGMMGGMASLPAWSQDWPQWGRNAQHTGATSVVGQPATHILDDVVYDPFVDAGEGRSALPPATCWSTTRCR